MRDCLFAADCADLEQEILLLAAGRVILPQDVESSAVIRISELGHQDLAVVGILGRAGGYNPSMGETRCGADEMR